ncbi:MAG: shikimate kinase [Bacteroidota bacterium]
MKIFLIGFMGSGKTTLGRKLARRMEYNFIDLDEFIENKESKKISKIFSSYGENKFRVMEAENLRLLEILKDAVISTGGGAPCFYDNMEWMNTRGITIYLKHDVESLFRRLRASNKKRPLIKGMSKGKLFNYIRETLALREEYYNQSKIIMEDVPLKAKDIEASVKEYLTKMGQ